MGKREAWAYPPSPGARPDPAGSRAAGGDFFPGMDCIALHAAMERLRCSRWSPGMPYDCKPTGPCHFTSSFSRLRNDAVS